MPYVEIDKDILQKEDINNNTNLENREWSFCKHLIEIHYPDDYDDDDDPNFYSEIMYRYSTLINSTISLEDYDDRIDGIHLRNCSLNNVLFKTIYTDCLEISRSKATALCFSHCSIESLEISGDTDLAIRPNEEDMDFQYKCDSLTLAEETHIATVHLDNIQINELYIDTVNHTEILRIFVKKSSERKDITTSIRKIIISKRVELRIYDDTGTMKDVPIVYIGDGALSTLTIEEED